MGAHTSTDVRASAKYQALLVAGMDDTTALAFIAANSPAPDPRLADLLQVMTEEEALQALASIDAGKTTAPASEAKPAKPAKPATAKDAANALIAERGFAPSTGLVYVNGTVLEGVARVLKTGTPEVVATSGTGRTKAVVIWRTEGGDAAVQNLKAKA